MKHELFLVGMVVFLSIIVGVSYEDKVEYDREIKLQKAKYDSLLNRCSFKDSLIIDMAAKMNQ